MRRPIGEIRWLISGATVIYDDDTAAPDMAERVADGELWDLVDMDAQVDNEQIQWVPFR